MGILDALDKKFNFDNVDFTQGPSTPAQPQAGSSSSTDTKGTLYQALLAARAKQQEELLESRDGAYGLGEVAERSLLGASPQKGRKASSSAGGFSLRYDTETPLHSIDVAGPGQEQRLADFVSKEIENNSQGLDVKTAMGSLGLKNPMDILPGLEFRLLGHQAIGVAWMIKMETEERWKGGILADDMGLGKTVQMIALMSKNMPGPKDEDKTTLIVVPAALMQQWKEEIETKSNGLFDVHIHHGKDKLTRTSQVKKKDVVITSYQTLCQDFHVPKDVVEAGEEQAYVAKNGGVLARTRFFRVIADEAQFIRNRGTRASISMALVRAKYRWMLTGTPVTNTLADLYGLLRFGRFAPWNDWPSFNDHIARVQIEDAPLAGERAQVILKPLLLRRTKNSTLEGKPILELPPKDIELVKLKFTREEREVYDHIEKKTKVRLNKFIRERTLLKNHAQVLVMILRLRQICCHPHLILSQSGEYDDPALMLGSEIEKELGRARKSMGIPWVNEIKQKFLLRAAATEILDFSDDDDASAPCCPDCQEVFTTDSAHVLACGHEMCSECILSTRNSPIAHDGIFDGDLAAEKAFEEAQAKGHRPCPVCKKMIDMADSKTFKSAAFEPSDEELTQYARTKRRAQWRNRRDDSPDVKMRRPPSPTGSMLESSDSDDLPELILKKPAPAPPKKAKKKVVMSSSDDDSEDDNPILGKPKGKAGKSAAKSTTRKDDSDSEIEFLGMSPAKLNTKPAVAAAKSTSKSKGKDGPKGKGKGKRKAADNTSDDDSDIEFLGMSPASKKKAKARKRARESPASGDDAETHAKHDPSEATLAIWSRGDDDMEPSTKMKALLKFIKEWESTGDKIIVYSQWTSMLDLLGILLDRHGLQSLRFDGKMDRHERDNTIATFKQRGGPKIMLISTKCGSVGLNLVAANRVINMDLSWNYAAESQAYDRCHRIGQDKPVWVKRLVVENTIEERMLRLQDVKTGLAEAALGEGAGGKLHKLSVKDIKYLFGMGPAAKEGPNNQRQNGSRSGNASRMESSDDMSE